MKASLRKRMYALQQRIAITSAEASFLAVIVGLIGVGGMVQWLYDPAPTIETAHYAIVDSLVSAGASRTVEDLFPADSAAMSEAEREIPPVQARTARLAPVRLDPNTASPQMLQRLPGIGPALAARIVEYRELNGPFTRPRDIVRVHGIGDRTFERLEPYLVIEPRESARQDSAPQRAVGPGASFPEGPSLEPLP